MNRPSLGVGFPPSAVRVANQAADFPMGCATAGNPELREAPQTCWKLEVEQFVINLIVGLHMIPIYIYHMN